MPYLYPLKDGSTTIVVHHSEKQITVKVTGVAMRSSQGSVFCVNLSGVNQQ